MVCAIIDGLKTQTRRIIKPPFEISPNCLLSRPDRHGGRFGSYPCPYGQPGDRLWVKETWVWNEDLSDPEKSKSPEWCFYRADGEIGSQLEDPEGFTGWRSGRFMPRWASRILLEVTMVGIERLQDISEADAIAEGSQTLFAKLPRPLQQAAWSERQQFQRIWNFINIKKHPWESNPWVWVIEFRRTA